MVPVLGGGYFSLPGAHSAPISEGHLSSSVFCVSHQSHRLGAPTAREPSQSGMRRRWVAFEVWQPARHLTPV